MKVKKLIKLLQAYDPNTEVVMSSDGEGNSYSPLADAGQGFYVAESTWSGDLYSEEEKPDDAKEVVCLWPTN